MPLSLSYLFHLVLFLILLKAMSENALKKLRRKARNKENLRGKLK
jgi:hypothetical protein